MPCLSGDGTFSFESFVLSLLLSKLHLDFRTVGGECVCTRVHETGQPGRAGWWEGAVKV